MEQKFKISIIDFMLENGKHKLGTDKNGSKTINVHRLIAGAFIKNTDTKPYVNHKDGNKKNNCINNLEWVTASENQIHAIKNGLYRPPKNNRPIVSKPVCQCDFLFNIIATYPSVNEAQRQTGISASHISKCAYGGSIRVSGKIKKWIKCNSIGGYKWLWKENLI